MAEIVRNELADTAKEQRSTLVEVGHIAAFAADKLRAAAVEQGIGKVEISTAEIEAIHAMMRDIQNKAHLAFLAAHGTEADYQAAGQRVARGYLPKRKAKPKART